MDVRVRMGDAIDPFQLANGVEAVIGNECQELRADVPAPAGQFMPDIIISVDILIICPT